MPTPTSSASPALTGSLTIERSTRTVDGITYHYGYLPQHGWSTGPCADLAAVFTRAAAYVSGTEITEAPNGIAGRGEMCAALAWARTAGIRDGGRTARLIEQALDFGIASDDWLRATQIVIAHYQAIVAHAGRITRPMIRLGGAS